MHYYRGVYLCLAMHWGADHHLVIECVMAHMVLWTIFFLFWHIVYVCLHLSHEMCWFGMMVSRVFVADGCRGLICLICDTGRREVLHTWALTCISFGPDRHKRIKKKIENVEEEQWTRRNINHVNKQTAESIQRIPSRESLLCLKRSIEAYMPRNIFGIPLPPGDKLNTTAHRQRIYIYISTSDPLRRTHSSCKGDGRIPPPSD